MKYLTILTITLSIFSGCSKQLEQVSNPATTVLPAQSVSAIKQTVDDENEYRLAAGQAPLVPGLVCTLHNLSTTTPNSIPNNPPSAIATFVYQGEFNQPEVSSSNGLNILPNALKSSYTQWYLVKCQGQFIADISAYYRFDLTSDDGAKLYLDNAVLIDNDGNHSSQTKTGSKLLKKGVHAFRLDYMQAGGNMSLILSDEFGIVSNERFYRQ